MHDGTHVQPRKSRKTSRYADVRAICCECGNLRWTSTYEASDEPDRDSIEFFARHGMGVPNRCTVRRKCGVCQRRTLHAWLRDDLTPAERAELERPLSDVLSPMVTSQIEQLEALGVRVWWEPETRWREKQVALVRQWLDDNEWHVELNSAAHVAHLSAALDVAWSLLTSAGDDVGGDGWRSVAGTPGDPDRPPSRYRVIGL